MDPDLERWPATPLLAAGEVQLWWRRDEDGVGPPLPESWLSADERERAARFRFERLQQSFRRRQAFLRGVLARAFGLVPASIEFAAGEHGKPFLAGARSAHFNLSHSESWLLVAVARGLEVGVDVQARLPLAELDAMARQIMTPAEHGHFAGAAAPARPALFYRLWTRKEAVLKASGLGLHREPATLHVGFDDIAEGALAAPAPGQDWDGVQALRDLPAPAGCDAALAARGTDWSVRCVLGAGPGPGR